MGRASNRPRTFPRVFNRLVAGAESLRRRGCQERRARGIASPSSVAGGSVLAGVRPCIVVTCVKSLGRQGERRALYFTFAVVWRFFFNLSTFAQPILSNPYSVTA